MNPESALSKLKTGQPDYRKLRLSNINTEMFRHVKMLFFWPVYGLLFMFVERFYDVEYRAVYSPMDDMIGFNELFLIPYLFWFVFLTGMLVYTFFYDVESFRRMMHFIIITYSVTIVIYFVFPTCQELRPINFERDNILTRITKAFYNFDTNTNVCPSIHVIGSWAVVFAAWHSKKEPAFWLKAVFTAMGLLISASTVFLKQHSIIDVIAALPLCALGYVLCYKIRSGRGVLKY
ncbi:MAG: phosphatase PAP2 family protein [Clostridia bacterium]|nr:phosphatase PAP2 family protein [Clostridia bacterium]